MERPAKRVRQACETCRRKKSRCSGDKPVCLTCGRVRQQCYYADERSLSPPVGGDRDALGDSVENAPVEPWRVDSLQSTMTDILNHLKNPSTLHRVDPAAQTPHITTPASPLLPPWKVVEDVTELYLTYCHSQPLPLFESASFIAGIRQPNLELIYSVLALALRFYSYTDSPLHQTSPERFAEEGRIGRFFAGWQKSRSLVDNVQAFTHQRLATRSSQRTPAVASLQKSAAS
ncbi:hypothetical protein BJY04DRAFT_222121 [Aspergillus karnatakaensis]|uniref:Zn(II)2Cys6 transcription factor domain-containing protein n=1 Tax=Aspergillus karnatakaensis TaxID=1810916 RepID=UPI003CCE4194